MAMAPKRLRQATLSFGGDGVEVRRPKKVSRENWNQRPCSDTLLVRLASTTLPSQKLSSGTRDDVSNTVPTNRKIAVSAFDLDDTIVCTKTGNVVPSSPRDWKFLNAHVVSRLEEEVACGKKLVVFSNQAGIGRGMLEASFVQDRIDSIAAEIGLPLAFYVATAKDRFRKPRTGMWDKYVEDIGGIDCVDLAMSFFCGDAAGRSAKGGRRADFSDSDRVFAENIGIAFRTPEEFFKGVG